MAKIVLAMAKMKTKIIEIQNGLVYEINFFIVALKFFGFSTSFIRARPPPPGPIGIGDFDWFVLINALCNLEFLLILYF